MFVQPALLEHKLQGAPKKARKVAFTDPFIYHALNDWLGRSRPDLGQIRPIRLSATGGVVAAYGEDCTIEASVEDGPKMGCDVARLFLSGP